MDSTVRVAGSSSAVLIDQPGNKIFRQYYSENDLALSPEGILKLLSVVACIITSVLFLTRHSCAGAGSLVSGGTGVALGCATLTALLYAATVLRLPLIAPQACLFIDIILSTVMGVLLLIMGVLTMTSCEMNNFSGYVHGPLGIINAVMVTSSAVITYRSVMRLWDAAHVVYEPPRPPPTEQDA